MTSGPDAPPRSLPRRACRAAGPVAALALTGCLMPVRPDHFGLSRPPASASGSTDPTGAATAPSPPGVAPPPPAKEAGPPVTVRTTFLVDGGWTSQVNHGSSGVAEVVLGALFERPDLTLGVMGRTGLRDDLLTSWAAALVVGRNFERPGVEQLALLGELGLSGLARSGKAQFIGTTTTSGGDTVLPYLGARLLVGLRRERPGLVFGLFAQQTLGRARTDYTVQECFLGCSTSPHAAVDGGFTIGLSLGFSHPATGWRSTPDAAPP